MGRDKRGMRKGEKMKTRILLGASIIFFIVLLAISCSQGLLGSTEKHQEQAAEENKPQLTSVVVVTISPSSVTVTRGMTQQFTASVEGEGDPSQEVTWSVTNGKSGTKIGSTGLLTVDSNEEPGTILTVTATSVPFNDRSGDASVEVSALVNAQAPVFNNQPQGAVYTTGRTATVLNGAAYVTDGGTVTYQWYSNTIDDNTNGTPLGIGALTASYTPPTTTAGELYYYVVVTNTITDNGDGGNKTAANTSNTAKITVNAQINALQPSITGQPEGATYTLNTTPVALAVTAASLDGGILSYQWYSNGTNSNSGGTSLGSANGAQTASYTPPTSITNTVYYYAVVTNSIADNGDGGSKTAAAASNTAVITVNAKANAAAPNITGNPAGATYVQNVPAAALTVTVTSPDGGTLSYQWYSNTTNSNSGGSPLGSASGAQTESYTPSTTATGTRYYYAVVTNTITDNGDGGTKTATATSNTVAITVNAMVNAAAPNITGNPAGAIYVQNATAAALTVTATSTDGGTLSFQWYSNQTNSNSGGTLLGSAGGAQTASYTPSTAATGTVYYYVVVTNTIPENGDGGNKTATAVSSTATITVNAKVNAQLPNIMGQPAAASYVQNVSAGPLTVLASSPDSGTLSYQWYYNLSDSNTGGTSLGSANGAQTANYTPLTAATGTLYYYVVVTNTIYNNGDGGNKSASSASNTAVITVNAQVNVKPPVISGEPQDAFYVQGAQAAALKVTASSPDGGTLTYQWYSNALPSTAGGISLGAGAKTASYTPPTAAVGTLYYYVLVTNTISDNGDGGTKISMLYSTVAEVTVNNKTNAASPNITGQPINATYVFSGTAAALKVTANSQDGGTLTYQWYSNLANSNTGGTSLGSANGAQTASYTPPTNTPGIKYYYVVVTNTITDNGDGGSKVATAASNTATITVNEQVNALPPVITVHPSNAEYDQNATAAALKVTANSQDGGAITYQWWSNTANNNTGGTSLGSANGAQTASYTPPTTAVGTLYYYVVVTNTLDNNGDGGTKTAALKSSQASIKVNSIVNAQTPSIGTQPLATTYEYSKNVAVKALTVGASVSDGGILTYQWWSNTANNNTGGTSITGATGSSYLPPISTLGTMYYYVVITNTNNSVNGNTSATARSNAVLVTVNKKTITINTATHTKVFDGNTTTTGITVTLSGMEIGDTVTASSITAAYTSINAGTTTIDITAMTLSDSNYQVTLPANNVSVSGGGITKKTITVNTATHTKVYDRGTSATGVTVTFSGAVSGNTVTASSVTAAYTSANAGTKTINITAMTLSNTNYQITLPINNVSVAGITPKAITTFTIGTVSGILSPIVPDVTFNVYSSDIITNDTVTIGLTNGSNYGLSLGNNYTAVTNSNKAVTIHYNGTTVTTGSAFNLALTLVSSPNYTLSGTYNVSVTIRDGQDGNRFIPVTQANFLAFHDYASCDPGLSKFYELTEDINMSGISWVPIGTYGSYDNWFSGSFDGKGHSISNFTRAIPYNEGGHSGGIFVKIYEGGEVKNLKLVNVSLSSENSNVNVAGVADVNAGIIENCYVQGAISSVSYAAGIVSSNSDGIVRNCYTSGAVTVTGNPTYTDVGGVVGDNTGQVINCYSTASVQGSNYCGGVVGRNFTAGTIQKCVALNTAITRNTGSTQTTFGRVAGYNEGTISTCYGKSAMTFTNITQAAATGNHGTDVASTTYNAQAFWQTTLGWDFSTIWIMSGSPLLPTLR